MTKFDAPTNRDTSDEPPKTPQEMCEEVWPKIFENQLSPLERDTMTVVANKLCSAFIPRVPGKLLEADLCFR